MTATLTRKGRITIPEAVRDKRDLKPGTRVRFIIDDGRPVAISAVRYSRDDLSGFPGPAPTESHTTI